MKIQQLTDIVLAYFGSHGYLRLFSTERGIAEIRIHEYFYLSLDVEGYYSPSIAVRTGSGRYKDVFFGEPPLECADEDEVIEMCARISEWCRLLLPEEHRSALRLESSAYPKEQQSSSVLGFAHTFIRDSLTGAEPLLYTLGESFHNALSNHHVHLNDLWTKYIEPYLYTIAHGPIQFTIDPRLAEEDSLAGKQWKILQDHYGYVLDPETLIAVER